MHTSAVAESAPYRNALPAGAELMEYRLEAVLGAGGFGLTYLAWDAHLHKRVALKEYLPTDIALRALDGSVVPVATQRGDDYRWGLERFLQEARTLAHFSHPHIVRVLRYFEANNTAYMVMEYERGESLSRLLKREPWPSEARLRAILMPLLDGLTAVHEAGFLHRDIKPSNLFLREQGGPVLIDFGAARHAIGGNANYTAVVTPGYAPLEQYSAEQRPGPWSDIYAMAGVFYRAVVNAPPPDAVTRMRRDTVADTLNAASERYGAGLLSAIGWGLELDEHRRPQSVAEWREGLLGTRPIPYVLGRPAGAAAPGEPEASAAADRRRRYRWAMVVAAVVLVVAWRLFDRERAPQTPVATRPAAPETTAPPSPPAPPPAAPAASKPATAPRATAPSRPRAETTRPVARPGGTTLPAEEGKAPVRDAVALPPLAPSERDRPGRDRSARPAYER